MFKRRKEYKKEAHRILRMKRMADGILRGDDCQAEWARREGLGQNQISRDFKEIFRDWLLVAKRSIGRRRSLRVKQLEETALFPAMQSFMLSKRVLNDCNACGGKGYQENKGACVPCQGEGIIERYDTPGDPAWTRVIVETMNQIAKIEGLHTKSLPPKPPKGPRRPHLHLHANTSDLWEHASHEEVVQHRVLMDKLQRRQENGQNGEGVKVIDVKKEDGDE